MNNSQLDYVSFPVLSIRLDTEHVFYNSINSHSRQARPFQKQSQMQPSLSIPSLKPPNSASKCKEERKTNQAKQVEQQYQQQQLIQVSSINQSFDNQTLNQNQMDQRQSKQNDRYQQQGNPLAMLQQQLGQQQRAGQQKNSDEKMQQNKSGGDKNNNDAIQDQIQSLKKEILYQEQQQPGLQNELLGQIMQQQSEEGQIPTAYQQEYEMNQLAQNLNMDLAGLNWQNMTSEQINQIHQLSEIEKIQKYQNTIENQRIQNIQNQLLQNSSNQQLQDIRQILQNQMVPIGNDPFNVRLQQALMQAEAGGFGVDDEANQELLNLAELDDAQRFQMGQDLQQQMLNQENENLQHNFNMDDMAQYNGGDSMMMEQQMENVEPHLEQYSLQSEQRKEIERKQDIEFEKQLRVFYKNMIERLNNTAIDKLQKKSKAFCEQIDKIQQDYIQERKDKKKHGKNDKDAKSEQNQSPDGLNDESGQNYEDRAPGEENDADSSFYSLLYGENSQLNPDTFIQDVFTTLKSHQDLTKWFKRFIPEDDEDDVISIEQKYQQFRRNLHFLTGGENDPADAPNSDNNNQINDQSDLINRKKAEVHDGFLKLLSEYADMKSKSCVEEAQKQYSHKIMALAEDYQKIVGDEIQLQIDGEINNQNIVFDENGNPIQIKNFTEQLEDQMNVILAFIPPEIVDNFHLSLKNQNNGTKQKKLDQVSKTDKNQDKKKRGRPRVKQDQNDAAKEDASDDFVSSSKIESSEIESKNEHLLDDENASDFKNSQSEEDEDEEKSAEGENESENEAEEDEEAEQEEEESEAEQNSPQVALSEEFEHSSQVNDEDSETISQQVRRIENQQQQQMENAQGTTSGFIRVKSFVPELYQKHGAMLSKLLNKFEVKILENLQRQLKTENDWMMFVKLFLIYIEGIISLKDFFEQFDHALGHKIKGDLKKDLQIFLPTRDTSRRVQSEILKPWNDLPNQKFEKILDSSYYRLDDDFPLPICSAKMDTANGGLYKQFLNDRYLSLSMGSENFKFKDRNINENMIFKNEDEMYKYDTQIEMFEKCQAIIQQEIKYYDDICAKNPKEKAKYEFPRHKFEPMMYFWEKKYKDALIPFLMTKPFQREYLIRLRTGIGGKLTELLSQKFDQLSAFEDIYRKNFIKSLDHRSFQYKEFIKKFLQKQQHMATVKQIAQENLSSVTRPINELKGGNFEESPYYHSFGQFIQHDFSQFDKGLDKNDVKDFPIDMNYDNFEDIVPQNQQKMPHFRMIFKDKEARNIAIKILFLHIRHSTTHHNNDRPRLTENLRQILENFMDITEYKKLNQSCGHGKIESLTPSQIDLIMNKDSHLYYFKRCQRLIMEQTSLTQQEEKDLDIMIYDNNQNENPESLELKNRYSKESEADPIKIQIQNTIQELQSPVVPAQALRESPSKLTLLEKKDQDEDLSVAAAGADEAASKRDNAEDNSIQEKSSKHSHNERDFKNLKFRGSLDANDDHKKLAADALFLPHYQDENQGSGNAGRTSYRLFYGPGNILMFIKFFYAIYERILKAKDLIIEKIQQDLLEMNHSEKVQAGIVNQETGEVNSFIVNQIFFKERYEHLLKGIYATTTQQIYSGTVGSSAGGAGHHFYSHNHHLMDHNKYEDFARQLLGNNAFLLFQIDKIVSQAIKQIQQMHSDHACQKALSLFQTLQAGREAGDVVMSDQLYMSYYAEQIVDQFSLKECQNHSTFKASFGNHQKFVYGTQGLGDSQNERSKAEVNSAGGPNQALTNISASVAALQQSNFQVFRFLWSPQSSILSIHYVNLNPYQIQLSGHRNYRKTMSDNFKTIKENTIGAYARPVADDGAEQSDCAAIANRLEDQISPPIFLKRNLKVMRKIRDKNIIKQVRNTMEMHVVPSLNQIVYNGEQEDVYVHPRQRKSKLTVAASLAKQDLEKQLKASSCKLQRLTNILSHSQKGQKQ